MKTSSIPKLWCIGDLPIGDTIPTEVKAIICWDSSKVEDKYGITILEPDNIEKILSIIMMEAVELGAAGYVRKPFTAEQIKEKLAGLY